MILVRENKYQENETGLITTETESGSGSGMVKRYGDFYIKINSDMSWELQAEEEVEIAGVIKN